jgi:hypothetical protein
LEEVDELFEAKLWAWNFSQYETHGTARLLTSLENEGTFGRKAVTEQTENIEEARGIDQTERTTK